MRIHFQDKPWLHPSMPGHPERAHRLAAALSGLSHLPSTAVSWSPLNPIPLSEAALAHDPAYLEMLADTDLTGSSRRLDGGDTIQSETTLQAALGALGGARQAVSEIFSQRTKTALLLARPAGHHACRDEAMGFCVFGIAAWAALDAQRTYGARVAVIDIDLHHGNGSQDILWGEQDIFFASTHEDGIYPGTGQMHETGAHGQILNIPLPKGSGATAMQEAWSRIMDRVEGFAPDLIVVSAGFDAHGHDPLSGLRWKLEDYDWIARKIADVADRVCSGRVLSILEGGYDLRVLRHAIAAYAAPLAALDAPESPETPPALDVGQWSSPYIGGASGRSSQGHDRFAVRKVNSRLWIEETETGTLLWTPPMFAKFTDRTPMQAVAAEATALDCLHIDRIIALEASAKRGFSYSQAAMPEHWA